MSLRVRMESIDSVTPHPSNPRRDHDVEGIARSISTYGWRQPIVVWDGDGHILAGHGRLLAARHLGRDKVPVHHVAADELTGSQAAAYRLADNRSAEGSEWDDALLLAELELLDERARAEAGFDEAYLEELRLRASAELPDGQSGRQMEPDAARQTLAERFGVPPFSVLNAREGWWQHRKAAWIALGIQSELGRGATASIGGSPMPLDRAKSEAVASFKNQGAQSALQAGKPHRKTATAEPGGSKMPAADYSKSKARGDGRGRAITGGQIHKDCGARFAGGLVNVLAGKRPR